MKTNNVNRFGRPNILESILDTPKEGMDPDVWTKNSDGQYIPTTYASQKIDAVVQWAVAKYGITDPVVHITGSIASNSYGDSSDIDLHFSSKTFKPTDVDEFNRAFRADFAKEFSPEKGDENGRIGIHPIEVYWQENPFQDMMSVGCYDYLERKWESGPEIKDTVFDPLSEYYEKDMKYVGKLADDIRNSVLGIYEKALVMERSDDAEFEKKMFEKLQAELKKAARLFTAIRNKRKVLSSPKSKEDALKMRKDRNWHVADSAFKLFDKFGYLSILREYTKLSERFESGEDVPTAKECVDVICDAVQAAFSDSKMLSDSELLSEADIEIPGMPGFNCKDIMLDIQAWIEERINDYGYGRDMKILGLAFHGSRTRNDFRPDSDLDVIVYYKGNEKESWIFNALNDEPKCTVNRITVDFWPTRDEESGSLDDVVKRNAEYDIKRGKLTEDELEEGLGSALRNAALAGMIFAPGFAHSATQSIDRPMLRQPVQTVTKEKVSAKTLSDVKLKNLLATIAYNETMLDWLKYRDDDEIIAVLNTIENRADKNKARYPQVISEPSQYFSAKHVKGGYTESTYKMYDPNDEAKAEGGQLSPSQKKCWELCQKYAQQAVDGKLKNVIGNRNMIGNPKKDTDKTAVGPNGWGKKCDKQVGGQIFGYQSEWDGEKRFGKKKLQVTKTKNTEEIKPNYTVKAGDTLWRIAKAKNTTVQKIKTDNKLMSDVIKPGQKLIV